LLVHNHRLYQQAELRAGLAERARLAREIHDGLAQTLGYLKLKVNQVQVWLAAGTSERAADGLAEVKQRLADAYIDAREAIDGLRLEGSDGSLEAWLTQIYQDFEALSRLRIQATAAPDLRLSPEVQSQLLRILQEALANVRKHAAASTVQVSWSMNAHWLVLAVIDDGIGFDPQEVAPIHRHGLQIMRERAELLGAELQLQSRPAQGTRLTVRLPRTVLVEAE
jgi:signal transduction histidine kinase